MQSSLASRLFNNIIHISPLLQLGFPPSVLGTQFRQMSDSDDGSSSSSSHPARYTPDVHKIKNFISSGGWDRCWEEGVTPWDLGQPTPILQQLILSESLPKGRALVPGCGSGYDVLALASPERYVVGLDVSEIAIKKARGMASSSPNAKYISLLQADFFTWEPSDLFDVIFDYTFFCAIEPNMRYAWARRMLELLKPDGELLTLMFPLDDHDGGPPYKTSVSDYEEVLHPMGFRATSIVDNQLAIAPRKGREKLGRWRCVTRMSSL